MIKKIEECLQAVRSARANGILDIYSDNKVQVTEALFEEILNEKGILEIKQRDCSEYPVKVEFTTNGFTYFTVYTAKGFENKFGGNIDEIITSN
ncbi:hypothetical protein EJ131_18035 [Bacillus mycoides]|uniref:hypothetical protein n=1 Tax=Bacillus mycoides TaxID=1405 RepID=UPI0022B53119|nr:hypothetical protein [Bacillus mycoides]MCZ6942400.1 hypothetical protein [Bacillus mycoides]